jgi:hypothetical protein
VFCPKNIPEVSWVLTDSRAPRANHANPKTRLPSFFIVGPPRTGTTWLHEVLAPKTLLPSPTKETRFFDLHFRRGLDWYLAHFPASVEHKAMGEVAPTYFASAHARERIARLIPQAKVVCVFRNPVDRILSLYRLKRAYGMLPWTFDQAIMKDPELVESGRYATHLKGWLNALDRNQVLVTVYEDLKRDPQTYLDTITGFLDVPRVSLTNQQLQTMHASEGLTHPRSYFLTRAANGIAQWFKAERLDRVVAAGKRKFLLKLLLGSGSSFEALSPDGARKLYELFRAEIEELESLLDRDFSAWKSAAAQASVVHVGA